MQCKLNPTGSVGATKINFPGFQKIMDYTVPDASAVTASVSVDGDVDKEYLVCARSIGSSISMTLNADTGNNYGYQYLFNNAGTISAARGVSANVTIGGNATGMYILSLLTPTGFTKTMLLNEFTWQSGTTIKYFLPVGFSWNSTANVTSISLIVPSSSAGTRLTVYARRSNV